MQYLLDASSVIDANAGFMNVNRVPEFWNWLEYYSDQDKIKIPQLIYNEIARGHKDELTDWINQDRIRSKVVLDEDFDLDNFHEVLRLGYGKDLTEVEIEALGRDPVLLVHAYKNDDRIIVTAEKSNKDLKRGKTKIPNACKALGIMTCDIIKVIRDLDFSTEEFKVSK